jgi:hypothetical protein
MPRRKLTEKEWKRIAEAKRECPCLKNSTIAMLFDVSQSRVGEVIRAEQAEYETKRRRFERQVEGEF